MTFYSPGLVTQSFWPNFFVQNQDISGLIVIVIYLALISFIAFLFSEYISLIYLDKDTPLRRYTRYIIEFFERIIGPISKKKMKFREYFLNLIFFDAIAAVIAFITIGFLNHPGNGPIATSGLNMSLTVHTVVSFITNTDLQHYTNPLNFSYFTTTFAIMGLMLIAPVTAFAASIAFIRGIRTAEGIIGNFYHDFLVACFDLFLPLTLLFTIIFILIGIPETVNTLIRVTIPITGNTGYIPIGPISSFEAFKNIGTNGAGFYGANAAFPLENPNWVSNITEVVAFTIIPLASVFSLGRVFGNRKFGQMLFGVIITLFLFVSIITFYAEMHGINAFTSLGLSFNGNMLGKESAIGVAQSSIFNVAATISSAGSTNSMLLNYTPGGTIGIMTGLLMNDPLGGTGTSVINIFTFVIFTAFLASLLVGKLPELLGFKLGSKEIKYSTLALITHPLIVLIPLGILATQFTLLKTFINPYPQKVTELFYEFLSAASNNGSEIGGFATNTALFNYIDSIIMLLGRFLLLGLQLYIAQLFANRNPRTESPNTVSVGSPYFGLMLFAVIIGLGLLSYFPVMALGPLLSFAKDLNFFIGGVLIGH